eukprot:gene25313-27413_t
MLEVARTRTVPAGSATPQYREADAQTADFAPGGFDALYSRFGVMFFADSVAAFANLGGALTSEGRLSFVCWRSIADNPSLREPVEAALPFLPPRPAFDPLAPGPFAFANPDRVKDILGRAGFGTVTVDRFDCMIGGSDAAQTLGYTLRIGPLGAALRENPDMIDAITEAVRGVLERYVDGTGLVRMPAAAWIVTARVGKNSGDQKSRQDEDLDDAEAGALQRVLGCHNYGVDRAVEIPRIKAEAGVCVSLARAAEWNLEMTDEFGRNVAANAIGGTIGNVIGGTLGSVVAGLVVASLAPAGAMGAGYVAAAVVFGLVFGSALWMTYSRYLAILAAGGQRPNMPGRKTYDALRASLGSGGWGGQIYAVRLTGFLGMVDRFFGDADVPETRRVNRVFGMQAPAALWTAPAFDRCLLLALVYPLGS